LFRLETGTVGQHLLPQRANRLPAHCLVAGQVSQPAIALQASASDAIADLAARGLAVALLSDSMAARYRDRLTARTKPRRSATSSCALDSMIKGGNKKIASTT